jgi:hypothetical protein
MGQVCTREQDDDYITTFLTVADMETQDKISE